MSDQPKPDSLEECRQEFYRWWKIQSKKDGPLYGCSENWGAWQAWQMAKLGRVYETND